MKILPVLVVTSLCICSAITKAVAAFAYMTLFNDNGNWAVATRITPDDEKVVYRACKNSNDRNADAHSEGSLAILCITICPEDDSAMLGLWHSEPPVNPGGELSCGIELDDKDKFYRRCKMIPSHYVTSQIVLSQDKKEIAKILSHKNLSLYLKHKTGGTAPKPLEFDLDPESLRTAANQIYDFFLMP